MKNNKPPLRGLSLAAILAFPFLAPALASAQTQPRPAPSQGAAGNSGMNRVEGSDREFLEDAAKSGMKEVTVAKAVLPRLVNPAVRTFAEMMVTGHTASNLELRTLAEKKGVALPVLNPADHTKEWSGKKEGADKDFIEEMIDDHEDAIERYESASRSKDADVVAFAQKVLPSLRQHHQQAEALQKAMH